jgi:hypothetical protein
MQTFFDTVTDRYGNSINNAEVTVTVYPGGGIATLFQDTAGTIPLANPFFTDGNGTILFAAANGQYLITVVASSVTDFPPRVATLYDVNNDPNSGAAVLQALNQPSGAGLVRTTDSNTVQQELNIKPTQVASVAVLLAATNTTLPASIIELSGYYGVGTAGGGTLAKLAAPTTANGVTIFNDASGNSWQRLLSPAEPIDVTWAGTKGDGTTDDTAAIQAAINVATTGGSVFYPKPASLYKVTGTLLFDAFQTHTGEAWANIRQYGGAIPIFKARTQATASTTFVTFECLTIINNDLSTWWTDTTGANTGIGLDLRECSHATVKNCRVRSNTRGIVFGKATLLGGFYNAVLDCEVASNFINIEGVVSANSVRVEGGRILSGRYGINATSCDQWTIFAAFEQNKIGVHTNNAVNGFAIPSGRFESNNRQLGSIVSITFAAGVVTVVNPFHFFLTGDSINVSGITQPEYNGVQTVTVVDYQTFTYPITGTPVSPATGTAVIKLLGGGAVIHEVGSFNNTVGAPLLSGADDRIIDLDGRNVNMSRYNGLIASSGINPPNLIANGDFHLDTDANGVPDGLTPTGALPVAGLTTAMDTSVKKTGTQSFHLTVAIAGTSQRNFRHTSRLEVGVRYTATIVYQTDTTANWNWRLGVTPDGTEYSNLSLMYCEAGFVTAKATFVATSTSLISSIYMNTATSAAASVAKNLWVNSITLVPGEFAADGGQANQPSAETYLLASLPNNPEIGESIIISELVKPQWFDGTTWRDSHANQYAATPTVAAAGALTLPAGEVITVTGNTNITSITATNQFNRRVTLIFTGTPTVTDGSNLKLAGNLVAAADTTITLVCNGTNWYETSRSVN